MKKNKFNYLILLIYIAFIVSSCLNDPIQIDISNSYQWKTSTPEKQGLDANVLSTALEVGESRTFINSILIVKNGYLISEKYYKGFDKNDAHHVLSVSKSFISAMVGIALENGYIDSLDQKMLDFFPEYVTPSLDTRKQEISIRHLLMMKAGFDRVIEDYNQNWQNWVDSPNWIQYIIEWPLVNEPGDVFAYITAETHLLSAILAKATGMSTLDFAENNLFDPLEISIQQWDIDPQGYYIGGFRMYFTPRNMARFGYLYLQNGRIKGNQIVPREWVEESWQDYSGFNNVEWGELKNVGYGYQWWLGELGDYKVKIALGYGGQFIIIFPDLDMIVVATSNGNFYKTEADEHERSVMDLVVNYILPAID